MIAELKAWLGWHAWLVNDRIRGWIRHLRKQDV